MLPYLDAKLGEGWLYEEEQRFRADRGRMIWAEGLP